MTDLFIAGLRIDWDSVDPASYLHGIPSVRRQNELSFGKNVTFFVGENGSGKSTLLEAIAASWGFNPEGGTKNYHFSTFNDVSPLCNAMTLIKGVRRPKYGFFFRAETFFNVVTEGLKEYESAEDYHAVSHGEGIFRLMQRFGANGLYLMDEPEAALSPSRQLEIAGLIRDLAKNGAQFIIATHSPILASLPGADVLSFEEGKILKIPYRETDGYRIYRQFFMEN